MSDLKNEYHSRRKFISLGLLAGAGMVAGDASAQSPTESGETLKMLTRDGKLVEIDRSLLPSSLKKKYATTRDVLGWIHPEK